MHQYGHNKSNSPTILTHVISDMDSVGSKGKSPRVRPMATG